MELTGLSGQIVGYVVLFTAYAIVVAGIFCVWYYLLFEVMIRYALTALKVYHRFAYFLLHYRAIKKYINEQNR